MLCLVVCGQRIVLNFNQNILTRLSVILLSISFYYTCSIVSTKSLNRLHLNLKPCSECRVVKGECFDKKIFNFGM